MNWEKEERKSLQAKEILRFKRMFLQTGLSGDTTSKRELHTMHFKLAVQIFGGKKDQNSPLSICISAGAEPVTLGCSSAFNSSCTWEEVCPDHDSSLWLSLRSNTGKSELFNVTIEFIQIQAQCRTRPGYTGFRRFLIESRFSFVVTVVLALALAACGVFGWNTRRKRSEEQKKLLENEEKQ